jgi:signal transduction histidine kinase
MLGDIVADAQRAAQVIRRLRTLFKKEHGERQPVAVSALIEEVLGLLARDLERRRIVVRLSLPPELPRVLGDAVQLEQVILNVIVNAAEAMTGQREPRELAVEVDADEAGIVAIVVRDTGPGVPASELERIFERFVTTKRDGLGMGLCISRSIVRAHGGRIWAAGDPGVGLTVRIELPCLETREPKGQ